MTDDEDLARVDYLVMEFPGDMMRGPGLALLADIMEVGVGRVLDLVFIRKGPDSSISIVDVTSLAAGGDGVSVDPDLSALLLARTGHLGEAEIAEAATHIDVGSSAGILVFEKSPARPDVVVPRQRTPSPVPSSPTVPSSRRSRSWDFSAG
ncbi:hypothetical protein KRR39_02730 [Nocardioides panacis]|uniref:DUF1269 domain-containing protein n=1 Tax=Nocardioides panacis TaxID=2849501 RepID=A0A975SZR7_9ACTN|nr:DUF6325 family protein [Nocardioides panacis]QWZ08787.1 hypothetical protein KRR39_02730 [Nocardioides panacis]